MTTTISHLPNELLTEVISFLSTPELLALCCTSKNLNTLATRSLYRVIRPRTTTQAIRCFQTIIAQRQAALAVKHFEIPFSCLRLNLLTGFFKLTATAIHHCAPSIKTLDLCLSSPTFRYLNVRATTLPQLVKFTLPYSQHPLTFLARHTLSIVSLHFRVDVLHFVSLRIWPTSARIPGPRIYLPRLKALDCDSAYIGSLQPPFALDYVAVMWHDDNGDDHEHENNDVQHLIHLLSSPLLRSMVNTTTRKDNTSLFQAFALAAHSASASTLTSLAFQVVDGPAFIKDLASSLGGFRALVHLSVMAMPRVSAETSFDLADKELEYVTRCGEVCPTLQTCVFPSKIGWGRLIIGCWVPLEGLEDKAKWKKRAIAAGKYAFLDEIDLVLLELSS